MAQMQQLELDIPKTMKELARAVHDPDIISKVTEMVTLLEPKAEKAFPNAWWDNIEKPFPAKTVCWSSVLYTVFESLTSPTV